MPEKTEEQVDLAVRIEFDSKSEMSNLAQMIDLINKSANTMEERLRVFRLHSAEA